MNAGRGKIQDRAAEATTAMLMMVSLSCRLGMIANLSQNANSVSDHSIQSKTSAGQALWIVSIQDPRVRVEQVILLKRNVIQRRL